MRGSYPWTTDQDGGQASHSRTCFCVFHPCRVFRQPISRGRSQGPCGDLWHPLDVASSRFDDEDRRGQPRQRPTVYCLRLVGFGVKVGRRNVHYAECDRQNHCIRVHRLLASVVAIRRDTVLPCLQTRGDLNRTDHDSWPQAKDLGFWSGCIHFVCQGVVSWFGSKGGSGSCTFAKAIGVRYIRLMSKSTGHYRK
jgi:hypothetical protein